MKSGSVSRVSLVEPRSHVVKVLVRYSPSEEPAGWCLVTLTCLSLSSQSRFSVSPP